MHTFAPGESEGTIGFTVFPDEISEGREDFYVYASGMYLGIVYIDDNPIVATLTPESVVVMEGDPFDMTLVLSREIRSYTMADLVSSDTAVAQTVLDSSLRIDGHTGYTIAMRAAGPGHATFSVVFPGASGIETPVASIEVFGGGVSAPETVTMRRGEEREITLTFSPAPPIPVGVMAESSAPSVVRTASDAQIPLSGETGLLLTAVAPGKSTVDLYTVYGRPLTSIEVTVLPSFNAASVNPTSGSASGGTTVTIAGENFAAPCSVKFGDVPAASVTFVNATTLRAVTPAHPAATANVNITCAGETQQLPGAFTFTASGRARAVRH